MFKYLVRYQNSLQMQIFTITNTARLLYVAVDKS